MISTAIVDSGPLIAAANTADPAHRACLEALRAPSTLLVIPALCVAEAAYVLARRQGPEVEAAFLRGLESFDVQAPAAEDWPRIADLAEEYADFPSVAPTRRSSPWRSGWGPTSSSRSIGGISPRSNHDTASISGSCPTTP